MLLLGHAAVSARRGPRGTCQETRAAPWAPAECGVTARSASDGVDVNGIRVHHRRLQYRKYQCGMFWGETPSRPRIPCVYGLEVGWAEDVVDRDACPYRCFALCAKGALLWGRWGSSATGSDGLRWQYPLRLFYLVHSHPNMAARCDMLRHSIGTALFVPNAG